MNRPVAHERPSPRWLALVWVVGTIGAIAISVVAVRLAGAQVTLRTAAPLTGEQVAHEVAEAPTTAGDAASLADGTAGDDSGSSNRGPGSGSGGSDDGSSSGPGSGSGSGSGSDGSGGSGGSGGSDDHGGSSTTVSGGGGSSGPGGGRSSGPGSGDDGGGGSSGPGGGGGHDGTTTTTVLPVIGTFIKTTPGGIVTVLCTNAQASLVAALPTLGWPIDVRNTGPQEVEVRFGSNGSQITVKARCSKGVVAWSS